MQEGQGRESRGAGWVFLGHQPAGLPRRPLASAHVGLGLSRGRWSALMVTEVTADGRLCRPEPCRPSEGQGARHWIPARSPLLQCCKPPPWTGLHSTCTAHPTEAGREPGPTAQRDVLVLMAATLTKPQKPALSQDTCNSSPPRRTPRPGAQGQRRHRW